MKNQTYEKLISNVTEEEIEEFLKREKLMAEAIEKVGVKQAVTNYLYGNAKFELGDYLPCGEKIETAADDIIKAVSIYISTRGRGLSDEELLNTITEKGNRYEGLEKIEYFGAIIFAQNFYSGKYADKNDTALRVEFNKIISRDSDETDEEVVNRLKSSVDLQTLKGCLELTEGDDLLSTLKNTSEEDGEKLSTMFEDFPTADEYAIKSVIVYSELTQGRIPEAESSLHPSLVSIAVCATADTAAILEKELKEEITHEQAELCLSFIETLFLFLFTVFFLTAVAAAVLAADIAVSSALFTIPVIGPFIGSMFASLSFVFLLIYLDSAIDDNSSFINKTYYTFEEIALVLKERLTIPCTEKLKRLFSKSKAPSVSTAECLSSSSSTVSAAAVTNPV